MTNPMIERVAKAIREELAESWPYTGYDLLIPTARAAIEALREPTEEQYEALSNSGLMWRDLTSSDVWKTYIDAALSES